MISGKTINNRDRDVFFDTETLCPMNVSISGVARGEGEVENTDGVVMVVV